MTHKHTLNNNASSVNQTHRSRSATKRFYVRNCLHNSSLVCYHGMQTHYTSDAHPPGAGAFPGNTLLDVVHGRGAISMQFQNQCVRVSRQVSNQKALNRQGLSWIQP